MKSFKMFLCSILFGFLICLGFGMAALAQVPTPAQNDLEFFSQITSFMSQAGGFAAGAKISFVCVLIIGSFKVSFLRPLWDKLGKAKDWSAPILSIVIGILAMHPFSWAGLAAYLFAGMGAKYLHDILDLVKLIPGLGSAYQAIISIFEYVLKKPTV